MKYKEAIRLAQCLWHRRHSVAAILVVVKTGERRTYAAVQYTVDHDGKHEPLLYILGEMPPFH